jgi:hypothetical protein
MSITVRSTHSEVYSPQCGVYQSVSVAEVVGKLIRK